MLVLASPMRSAFTAAWAPISLARIGDLASAALSRLNVNPCGLWRHRTGGRWDAGILPVSPPAYARLLAGLPRRRFGTLVGGFTWTMCAPSASCPPHGGPGAFALQRLLARAAPSPRTRWRWSSLQPSTHVVGWPCYAKAPTRALAQMHVGLAGFYAWLRRGTGRPPARLAPTRWRAFVQGRAVLVKAKKIAQRPGRGRRGYLAKMRSRRRRGWRCAMPPWSNCCTAAGCVGSWWAWNVPGSPTPSLGRGWVDLQAAWCMCAARAPNAPQPARGDAAWQPCRAWLALSAWLAVYPAGDGRHALFRGRHGAAADRPSRSGCACAPAWPAGRISEARPIPHMLRHSFASHVPQSAGDLRAVQELLGHASISATGLHPAGLPAPGQGAYDQRAPRGTGDPSSQAPGAQSGDEDDPTTRR